MVADEKREAVLVTITISKFKLAVGVIAVALLGVSTAAMATHTFSDVPDGEFYTEPVEWLADNGLTTGSPSGSDTFKPFDNVTRGEYATFNFRYDQNIVQPALEELEDDIEDLEGATTPTRSRTTPPTAPLRGATTSLWTTMARPTSPGRSSGTSAAAERSCSTGCSRPGHRSIPSW